MCLRGDEDGGGGDDAARAAEDGQPVSAQTGSAPGGASARPGPAPCAAELAVPPPLDPTLPSRPRPPACVPPAVPAEAMEDEERQKKLEAGKAKVREPEAARPALGGGGRGGLGRVLRGGGLSLAAPARCLGRRCCGVCRRLALVCLF